MRKPKMKSKEYTSLTKITGVFNHTGLDGAGKGTQIAAFAAKLNAAGYETHVCKAYCDKEKKKWEPTVNKLLRCKAVGDFLVTVLFQMFHRKQVTEALNERKKGKIVVADRWDEGFLAYHRQNGFLAKTPNVRRALLGHGFQGYIPHKTVFYDLDPTVAKERMMSRGSMDGFDAKPSEHHTKMRHGFKNIAEERDWITVDAHQDIEAIANEVWQLLLPTILSLDTVDIFETISASEV